MRFNPQARRERVWLKTRTSNAFEQALRYPVIAHLIGEEQD